MPSGSASSVKATSNGKPASSRASAASVSSLASPPARNGAASPVASTSAKSIEVLEREEAANGQHNDEEGVESEEESSEDEDDEEEEEPTLKYARLGHATTQLFDKDSASAMGVSSRHIVIGTHSGHLFILSHQGELVKRFKPHQASILDIDIDATGDFIGTASVDGKVAILQLSIPELVVHDMKRPMRTVSLEPNFGKRNTRQFVCGGMAGALILHEKGWLGSKEVPLFSGEGPIWTTRWRGTLIAWANDEGVRIYDTSVSQRIGFIPRAADSPRADLFKCTLNWRDDKTLIVAWADYIRIVRIVERANAKTGTTSTVGELAAVFQVDSMISGIAPYDNNSFILLAYVTEETYGDEATEDREQQKRKEAQRPELRIISADGEELSSDALTLHGFARYGCSDYHLVPSKVDNAHYVVSPGDLIVARPRDESDHVAWLVEHRRYKDALKAVETLGVEGQGAFDVLEIGKRYLEHLVQQGHYAEAAELCPKIFGTNVKAWEDWIFLFIEKGEIQAIIPYLPTHEPQLDHVVYEMVLAHFLLADPEALLRTIRTWPKEIYDLDAIIAAVEGALDRDKPSVILMDCLADLYLYNRQYSKALPYFLRLRRSGVFDLIRDHNLFTAIQDQAVLLIEFDRDLQRGKGKEAPKAEGEQTVDVDARVPHPARHGAAIELLVDHTHSIPIPRIVNQLTPHRQYLFMYLDALFDKDPHLAFDYSDLQVDLYAEYDYAKLIDFLRASNYYSLEKAFEICKARDLVPEMVFLLGRMGNNKTALALIIERMGDVQRAIEFAKEQNDHDLWEDLLKYSETRPRFIRGLLENVGAEIDPVRLIRRIKNGLEIPGLKSALIKILQDFNLQISLMDGCESILFSDCRQLSLELQDGQASAFFGNPLIACHRCGKAAFSGADPIRASTAKGMTIIFLCRHVYHLGCAFPDETDFPPRPEHALAPSLSFNTDPSPITVTAKALDARIRFSAMLRSRTRTRCPACAAAPQRAAPA